MKRITGAAALLLLLAIVSLCTYSGFEYERHLPYPTRKEIVSDYQRYIGKTVSIYGTVKSITENSSVVYSSGLNFTVAPLEAKAGDLVEILGRLGRTTTSRWRRLLPTTV